MIVGVVLCALIWFTGPLWRPTPIRTLIKCYGNDEIGMCEVKIGGLKSIHFYDGCSCDPKRLIK